MRRSLAFGLGALAGASAFLLRRRRGAARVDVFYEDGSTASLEPRGQQAERMLIAARAALAAARAAA